MPGMRSGRGIIPACAGSTRILLHKDDPVWDHPRMCGEHPIFDHWQARATGSSPHVRGARAGRARPAGPSGIIPACAGSTLTPATSRCTSGDHPRMCGEHYGDSDFVNELEGSSPHVRGARFIKSATQDAVGIIPACAGSTVEQLFLTTVIGDHPRMCGEHTDLGKIVRVQWGSSPHVRGAHYP